MVVENARFAANSATNLPQIFWLDLSRLAAEEGNNYSFWAASLEETQDLIDELDLFCKF